MKNLFETIQESFGTINESSVHKGEFTIDGIEFKSANVNRGGADHNVTVYLKTPDYRKVKKASEALRKVEKKFFGDKTSLGGGYDQSGAYVLSDTYSEKDATSFAEYLLTL